MADKYIKLSKVRKGMKIQWAGEIVTLDTVYAPGSGGYMNFNIQGKESLACGHKSDTVQIYEN